MYPCLYSDLIFVFYLDLYVFVNDFVQVLVHIKLTESYKIVFKISIIPPT